MAENALPRRLNDLLTLAEDAADGAHQYEVAIGLKQNDEAAIRAGLAAMQTAEGEYQAAQVAKRNLYTAQQMADDNGRAYIGLAGKVLGNFLGTQWSEAWLETGFPNQSTAVPNVIGQRQALLTTLAAYFTNHPTHANAPLNVTAAQATALFAALSDARSAVNAGLTQVGQKRAARDAARRQLERRLRGLIEELDQLLEADDPRWLSFGLNMPASDVTPEGPTALVLTAAANSMIDADWADVPNADHYRVFVQVVGVNPEFVAEPTTFGDSDATLGPYQPGQVVRVKVAAVSGGLEGPASEVAEMTLAGGGGGGGGSGLPAVPAVPTLTNAVDGQVLADWPVVPGAQGYHMFKQLVGLDTGFVDAGLNTISQANFSSLPPGETFRVKVAAVNGVGESEAGPFAEIVVT